jgi:alpha-galactosidase/6-phospho-beta-glucosidase family protein
VSVRITIVGGGSHQWAPTLITDIANTPSIADAELVLLDTDETRLPLIERYAEHVADVLGIGLTVRTTTNQRDALRDADFVIVTISTGGFESMRHDLDIPARYGIVQPVGDTVGPGGISRSLRNVPVLVGLARDMEALCPRAWMLNITNPMTALCEAVNRSSSIRTVGLCHEVTITSFWFCVFLEADGAALDPVVTGVNHLPIVTDMTLRHPDGSTEDGLARLRGVLADDDWLDEPLPAWVVDAVNNVGAIPGAFGFDRPGDGPLPRRRMAEWHGAKLELFARFGALPFAADRHTVEFFPGFLTEESSWGRRWGVHVTTIDERIEAERRYLAALDELVAGPDVARGVSTELVAPLMDSLVTGSRREIPVNIANHGQCPDLPEGFVVESIGVVDGDGVRGRDVARAPAPLAASVCRVAESQDLTVAAALTGDRDLVLGAMLADPLAGRIDFDRLERMTDELLAATSAWLPQFD